MEFEHYENVCLRELDQDDGTVLETRYRQYEEELRKIKSRAASGRISRIIPSNSRRMKTQWTRIHDEVQEHFSSHVLINNSMHQLPPSIYALKHTAKQSWMLYKKRECERRKRLRQKLEKERMIEKQGGPANILLSMVDSCEICKKLYISVNLFWGITLCDICYFNPEVIQDIMSQRVKQDKEKEQLDMKAFCTKDVDVSENEKFFQIIEEEHQALMGCEKVKEKEEEQKPSQPPMTEDEILSFIAANSTADEEEVTQIMTDVYEMGHFLESPNFNVNEIYFDYLLFLKTFLNLAPACFIVRFPTFDPIFANVFPPL